MASVLTVPALLLLFLALFLALFLFRYFPVLPPFFFLRLIAIGCPGFSGSGSNLPHPKTTQGVFIVPSDIGCANKMFPQKG